jgi:hypothetical protein
MKPRHVIFIRSYAKDLPWLQYCLRSITKFCTGHDAVVVVVPDRDVHAFRAVGIDAKGCGNPNPATDYLGQQVTKLHADEFCGAGDPWIIYTDSDCIFTAPVTMDHFFRDGKPISLHTPYAMLPKPPAMPWKALTERCLGFVCHDERMRRQGAVYQASELAEFRAWFLANRGETIDAYVGKLKHHDFSEFNCMGMWLWRFKHGTRCWIRTDVDPIPPLPLRQGYSWDGIDKDRATIEKLLA